LQQTERQSDQQEEFSKNIDCKLLTFTNTFHNFNIRL